MGRVVKNARVNAQRYAVPVPPVERPDHFGALDEAFTEPAPADLPAPFIPAAPVVDLDAVTTDLRALIDMAEGQAKAMLSDARDRAQAMLHDAAARADELIATVQAQAHDDGYAAGAAAADREMSDMMATMSNLVDMARAERHKLMVSAEPELVRLAMGIAERILHQQVALDRGVVIEMTKVAIARLVDRESVTVRVNPADVERMREHREEFLNAGDIKNFRVIEDQRVDRGGVVVEADGGTIDARISTQLGEAKRVLRIDDEVIVKPADERDSTLRAARAS
jgi:flagellar assembly protein FliH